MKSKFLAVLFSGMWISISEFFRNEILFKQLWLEKYQSLNVVFPSEPINGAIWGVWSFLMAGVILFLVQRLKFIETVFVSWIMSFVMMWFVIGNLNVLPLKLLIFAVPLSLLEVVFAAVISLKMVPSRVNHI